ncbi:hypothetical protein NRY95_03465 [Xanthomonas campestris pv. phormiicola]|nr:hypothetical protein [Xanthomonas campestris pv. phormiicola]UYC17042.1 hypothetical protein NRY95_03465 [Xanthomonas campestris pv. phormiicola]
MKNRFWVSASTAVLIAACSGQQQSSSADISIGTRQAAKATFATEADRPLISVPPGLVDARPSEHVSCYADVVEGAERTSSGWQVAADTARLSGWAVDADHKQQPPAVLVLKGGAGTFVFKASRTVRDDVSNAEQFKSVSPVLPGIAVSMLLNAVPAGTYQLALTVGEGDAAHSCELGEANRLVIR